MFLKKGRGGLPRSPPLRVIDSRVDFAPPISKLDILRPAWRKENEQCNNASQLASDAVTSRKTSPIRSYITRAILGRK